MVSNLGCVEAYYIRLGIFIEFAFGQSSCFEATCNPTSSLIESLFYLTLWIKSSDSLSTETTQDSSPLPIYIS
jgi:hypothetical protein